MKRSSSIKSILILFLLVFLAGCGTFTVQVEPVATLTSTDLPLSNLIATQTASPASMVATETPTVAPTHSSTFTTEPRAQTINPGTPVKIINLQMFDSETGWALGEVDSDSIQHLLFTQDIGKTWVDRTPVQVLADGEKEKVIGNFYFASLDEGWAIFTPEQMSQNRQDILLVWQTKDGGVSWTSSQAIALTDMPMEFHIPSDLKFLDDQHGWFLIHLGVGMSHDYFAVLTTADGGRTWTRVVDPNTKDPIMSCSKSGITFISPENGWLMGNCPGLMPKLFIFQTQDGGRNWMENTLPVPVGKTTDYFSKGDIGCGIDHIDRSTSQLVILTLVCRNFTNNTIQAWLYSSSNGGIEWSQHLLPVPYGKTSMYSAEGGFLLGSFNTDPASGGVIYRSVDGGNSWSLVTSTGWTGTPDFIDSKNGWVIAVQDQATALVHTNDGGITWSDLKPVIGK